MPVKKKEERHDPLKRPGSDELNKPEDRAAQTANKPAPAPLAIAPRFTYAAGGEILFDSPVKELVRFGEVLLALLENEAMFVCNDGKTWHRFVFEIVPITEEV